MSAAIRLHNLTVAYQGHPAVHHLSGSFEAGTLTAIVGPNGAGKSTLLAALSGQLAANEGHVEVDPAMRQRMAWLPQQHQIDRSFPLSAFELVATGLWWQTGAWRKFTAAQRMKVHDALQAVGLAGFERRALHELSAGQFQRLLFARVLLQDAPLILLDEPFNAIDARTTADLLALVARWQGEQRTVLAVLHDLDQVRAHFPQTLLMARGTVAWGPTPEALSPTHLLTARRMAESWDEQAPRCTVRAA
jgi:zinc/manganese transport system ATP-binding protein